MSIARLGSLNRGFITKFGDRTRRMSDIIPHFNGGDASPGGSAGAPLLQGDMADDAADGLLLEGDMAPGVLLYQGDEA